MSRSPVRRLERTGGPVVGLRWAATVAAALLATLGPIGASILVASPPAAAVSGPTWPLLVANADADSLTDVGPSWSGTVSLPGVATGAVALTPDGHDAYAGDGASTVSVIENASSSSPSVLANLSVSSKPMGIAITPDGKYAYVSNWGAGKTRGTTVSVIDNADSSSPSVSSTTLTVGQAPWSIAITPDGKYAYVANASSGTVSVIDNADSSSPSVSSTTLSVGEEPEYIAITPDGNYAYVVNEESNTVSVIDNADSSSPSVSSTTLSVGDAPGGIAITADGKYAYVANQLGNTISLIDNPDSSSPSVSSTTLSVSGEPEDVELAPDESVAYVSRYTSDVVSVINNPDSSSPSVSSTTYATGTEPAGISVVPDQAPVAALSVTPGEAGATTSFSASASTVAYGTITSYAWSFGDGDQATTATPTTTHVYAAAGSYTASVTETDSAGTSTSQVSEGKAVLQNGGSSATATSDVTIGSPPSSPLLLAPPAVSWSSTLSGYNQSLPNAVTLEVSNSGSSGWDLTIEASSQPTSGSYTLAAPTLNGSASSASSGTAPAQSCVGSCTTASGNSVSYPLTIPVGTAADLYNAAANSGIGEEALATEWWVVVAADTYSSSGGYSTTITLTISTGP